MRTPVFWEGGSVTPAAILNALHQPMTFAELRAELLGTAHNGTMSDDRKLSSRLRSLRKQGRVDLLTVREYTFPTKLWVKVEPLEFCTCA
jgi:hypothetical protein